MTASTPPLTNEEELYWLALRMVPGLGTRRIGQLLERLRTPQAIFRASASELEAAGLARRRGPLRRQRLQLRRRRRSAAEGARGRRAADHPRRLPAIPNPCARFSTRPRYCSPAAAWNCSPPSRIGVVGTRHPTPYGIAAAERLSGDLARAGVTIISGMARGIDTAAHKAALAAEGSTIAVLGCGVDIVYPSENRKLAAEIAAKGLIALRIPHGSRWPSRRTSPSATASSAA